MVTLETPGGGSATADSGDALLTDSSSSELNGSFHRRPSIVKDMNDSIVEADNFESGSSSGEDVMNPTAAVHSDGRSVTVAALTMDDMIAWMQEGGQVGIFDATNSTKRRTNMLMKMAEGKCKARL
ncbi:hypothetical protein K2173_010230 [Erythroxylum novogranatense]|uniref:6-phosphofructo-2-kinase domain-containing protein n=1 Tax=Erythroxylum novogranatense TaxID=1862640 RepID=A0AAV8UCY9_9ROSI|nr:hypothetical protein K2173_010230 [Erythroxylum novogranatense]